MTLDKDIEKYYISILKAANLFVGEDGEIYRLGMVDEEPQKVKTKDGLILTLPYTECLRKPQGRQFYHLLNEDYNKPDSVTFNLNKNNNTLSVNLKLCGLISKLIEIGSKPALQKMIKGKELREIIEGIGKVDVSIAEALQTTIYPKATKLKGVGPLLSFYIKKNGEYKGEVFKATGKVNFVFYKELEKGSNKAGKDYLIYNDIKVRAKDITAFTAIMEVIFPDITNEEAWTVGVDNTVFRCLDALMQTNYLVTSRMNDIANMIGEQLDCQEEMDLLLTDTEWTTVLQALYDKPKVIREIRNQDNMHSEGVARIESQGGNRLNLNVGASATAGIVDNTAQTHRAVAQPEQPSIPSFQPPSQPTTQTNVNPLDLLGGSNGLTGNFGLNTTQPASNVMASLGVTNYNPSVEDIIYGRAPDRSQVQEYQLRQQALIDEARLQAMNSLSTNNTLASLGLVDNRPRLPSGEPMPEWFLKAEAEKAKKKEAMLLEEAIRTNSLGQGQASNVSPEVAAIMMRKQLEEQDLKNEILRLQLEQARNGNNNNSNGFGSISGYDSVGYTNNESAFGGGGVPSSVSAIFGRNNAGGGNSYFGNN